MVQDVKELRPELQGEALGKLEGLERREIEVMVLRSKSRGWVASQQLKAG